MQQLVEAVPNISEGQNPDVLRSLRSTILAHGAVKLLGMDVNPSAHRTVFTLLGEPAPVQSTLLDLIAQAARLIDMRLHRGAHPRLGAVDVCPLIPLQNITLTQTAQLARELGRQVGQTGIPVYFYEAAALSPQRQNLAFIRRGGYESLPQKLKELPPDAGPDTFSLTAQRTGACIIGARNILIAFNINLNTSAAEAARLIAAKIRQSAGGMRGVKAIGWYMDCYGRAQVSCNITDHQAAPLHAVYEACQQEAAALGLRATGCELIGLAPLQALLTAGRHYAPQATDENALIEAAAHGLNLCEVRPFKPQEQILEFKAGLAHR